MILFILSIFSMISVAFFTLLERKLLSVCQNRKGPNKMFMFGILQPFGDVLKMFSKHTILPLKVDVFYFIFFPSLNVIMFLSFWSFFPLINLTEQMNMIFGGFLSLWSLSGLFIIMSGWGSSSSFSLLGSVRGSIQFLSFEIIISFVWFSLFITALSYRVLNDVWKFICLLLFVVCIIILLFLFLVEGQRSPFDFPEGESELVSGFNTEFSSVLFCLVFLSEYGFILFSSGVISLLLFTNTLLVFTMVGLMVSLIIIVRGTFPRLRFDVLQLMAWKIMLPVCVLVLLFSFVKM